MGQGQTSKEKTNWQVIGRRVFEVRRGYIDGIGVFHAGFEEIMQEPMPRPPIRTKRQMYKLLLAGAFGNYVRAWNTYEELLASNYRGLVSLRSRAVSNPVRLYHIPFDQLHATTATLPTGQREAGLVFSEAPPDEYRTIQGEVMRTHHGLTLTYSHAPLPMRLAFEQECLTAVGQRAVMLLRYHLDPNDYDHLMELLDTWDGHVVEFSAFGRPVGTLPGSRLIIWEVRYY